jgi:hypothetical protein
VKGEKKAGKARKGRAGGRKQQAEVSKQGASNIK